MKLENQNYYYLSKKARIIFGLLSIMLAALSFFLEDVGIIFISIWSVIWLFIGSCLCFSKLYITNESVKLTWSPFVTTMKWSDAVGIKIGFQKNIPGRTLYVRLKNQSLAYFTIHQMSQYNFKQICDHFGVDPNDGDTIESEFFTPPQVKKKEVVFKVGNLKIKLESILSTLFFAYILGALYILITFKEEANLSIYLSFIVFVIPTTILSFYVNFKWPTLFFEIGASKMKIFVFAMMMAIVIPLFNSPYLSLVNRIFGAQEEITIISPIIDKSLKGENSNGYFCLEQKNQLGLNYEFQVSEVDYKKYRKGDIYIMKGKVGCLGIVYR